MPIQNINLKVFAYPDFILATQLLQILTFNSLIFKQGNLHFSHVLEDDLL